MDFSNYLFRCSALGKIIPKPKGRGGEKTYLEELFIGEINGIKKDISSKYLDKGNSCERDGMDILKEALYPKDKSLLRHIKQLSNEYVKGTPDVVKPDFLYDIKNAYDRFTFGKAECSWEYEWQVKAYLWLKGMTKGRLFYVLCNMPEEMIQEEERKLFYTLRPKPLTFESEDYKIACQELRKKLDFTEMKLHERFKIWDIELTDMDIHNIKISVLNARNYLQELNKNQEFLYEKNLDLMIEARK